jgi:AcrR family transcriptional regulator
MPRNRKAPLSRERVLAAALALADRDGVEQLSMRNLAENLQVEAMSLYRHVANKEAILDGIVDAVVGEITLPPLPRPSSPRAWKNWLRKRCLAAHEVLLRHPWATMLLLSRINTGPNMLAYADATLGCLRSAGFPLREVDAAWQTLDSYVYGFTLILLNFPIPQEEYADKAREFSPVFAEGNYPHLAALSELITTRRYDGITPFAYGLDLLLDALERSRKKRQA